MVSKKGCRFVGAVTIIVVGAGQVGAVN